MVNGAQRYEVCVLQPCEPINVKDWQHILYLASNAVDNFQSHLVHRPLSESRVA